MSPCSSAGIANFSLGLAPLTSSCFFLIQGGRRHGERWLEVGKRCGHQGSANLIYMFLDACWTWGRLAQSEARVFQTLTVVREASVSSLTPKCYSLDTHAGPVLGSGTPTSPSWFTLGKSWLQIPVKHLQCMSLGRYTIKEREKKKKTPKADLINEGSLKSKEVLISCSVIYCSVRQVQEFLLVSASVNSLWHDCPPPPAFNMHLPVPS